MTTELPPALIALASAAASEADPRAVFRAAEAANAALVGHRLFTILFVVPGGAEVERVHSSDPVAYPLTGRKHMGPTPWGDLVLKQGRTWLGNGMDDIRWAFYDHETIARLGCAACINIPVREGGEVVGTLNILDAADSYTERDVATAEVIGGFLPGALRRAATLAAAAARD
ncbi:GAF domain-containing protein [Roseomonas rosulenta]|uniref:GAF domain-containing protein n=1 Tax=Roseomonas rosulenta TaxID=2748667 RepID=UPI0018E018CA|nr:GAF domain-containing protein [Roseomonas rosulenta]